MDTSDFIKLIKKRKTAMIITILIFVIVGLIVTLGQPLKYRAKSRLLILQPNTGADAYAIAKSNEYVGGLISEVIYSGSFLDSLNTSGYTFDRNYFNGNYKDNVEKWKKTVSAKSSGDTGVIDIEIYHTNPEEALKISQAVNQLIISGQSPYRFNPDQTKLNVIDQPVVSSFPVKPNLLVNLALSLLFGFLAGCSYIYLFPKEKISRKIAKKIIDAENLKTEYQKPTRGYNAEAIINNRQPTTAPENLPISSNEFKNETREPDEPFRFKGNIANILGE